MRKVLFCMLAGIGMLLGSCNNNNPDIPDDPGKQDTIPHVDTIPQDTPIVVTIDTIRIDTLYRDTTYAVENDYIVLAYVPGYSRRALPNPMYFTHIIYSCCELYVRDKVYQKFELSDSSAGQGLDIENFHKVLALREQNPNLKIMVSIASVVNNTKDNYQDGGFSALCADAKQRKHFAEDCLAFCEKYNLDGIDIDWELPGMKSTNNPNVDIVNDVDNFTLLMKELKETLGDKYLVTFAGWVFDKTAIEGGWEGIDLKAVAPYVDWCNVMTYEMGSGTQPHNAIRSAGYWDINRTFRAYQKAEFPSKKMVLGIPFYSNISGEFSYNKIDMYLRKKPDVYQAGYNSYWQVPFLKKNGEMIGSYDDARSIGNKGKFAKENNWLGLMCWEATSDDDNGTLSQAMWNAMKTQTDTIVTYNYYLSDSTMVSEEIWKKK